MDLKGTKHETSRVHSAGQDKILRQAPVNMVMNEYSMKLLYIISLLYHKFFKPSVVYYFSPMSEDSAKLFYFSNFYKNMDIQQILLNQNSQFAKVP